MVVSESAPQSRGSRADSSSKADGRPAGRLATAGSFGWKLSGLTDDLFERIAPTPWAAHSGLSPLGHRPEVKLPLYTTEERARRDASPWTTVQAVLAPLQFVAFAVSLALVVRYLATGAGYEAATISILVKTGALYLIMVTGSIWEKRVFGKWLFARAFFWEDVFSMLVLALQTTYLCMLGAGVGSRRQQMAIAIAAYAAYVINAAQFLLKLRAARLEGQLRPAGASGRMGRAT